MRSQYARALEAEAEALIAAGNRTDAIRICETIAAYYDGEEANCDRAGEYAEGMRASRNAEAWRHRADELRSVNANGGPTRSS